jgi:hypothetical protein
VLKQLQPGDILLLHDIPPDSEERTVYWSRELDHLFSHLSQANRVVPLADCIGRPIMTTVEKQPD